VNSDSAPENRATPPISCQAFRGPPAGPAADRIGLPHCRIIRLRRMQESPSVCRLTAFDAARRSGGDRGEGLDARLAQVAVISLSRSGDCVGKPIVRAESVPLCQCGSRPVDAADAYMRNPRTELPASDPFPAGLARRITWLPTGCSSAGAHGWGDHQRQVVTAGARLSVQGGRAAGGPSTRGDQRDPADAGGRPRVPRPCGRRGGSPALGGGPGPLRGPGPQDSAGAVTARPISAAPPTPACFRPPATAVAPLGVARRMPYRRRYDSAPNACSWRSSYERMAGLDQTPTGERPCRTSPSTTPSR
jgi:hypothetical protein